ncbi:hypothetical protein Anapl_10611 [Anas platyrhynchos]|uniref:Uncharacterized protein n=1 Tax=Anas platyrhynchos TaxID=8839 RepID=R0L925_ANAPL|nr:hypothetical protein Anapl_10611 [Anas platyrhynchos]
MRIISTRARSVVESRMGFIQLYGSVFKQRLNVVLISPIFHRSTRRKYCTCMTKQAGQEPPPPTSSKPSDPVAPREEHKPWRLALLLRQFDYDRQHKSAGITAIASGLPFLRAAVAISL